MDSAQFFRDIADTLVFEHGKFDPLRFLIDAGFLDEDMHVQWLAGEHEDLETVLACEVEEALEALDLARRYLSKQGLREEPRTPVESKTRLGSTPAFIKACAAFLKPAQPQADCFATRPDWLRSRS